MKKGKQLVGTKITKKKESNKKKELEEEDEKDLEEQNEKVSLCRKRFNIMI